MKSAVILFPGINRENDAIAALEQATGTKPIVVWHGETELPKTDIIMVPGGFSYGDYLRCGAMAAKSPIMRAVADRAKAGVTILGVCNGFQILTEAGLLPGALMRNASLKFICKNTHLKIENADTRFTNQYKAGEVVDYPVAHHDGNFFADSETLDRLEGEGRVILRYCDADGVVDPKTNLNGSQRNIAGIINEAGNVLGMMPHPENAIDPLHGGTDGRNLFKSLVEAAS
ncbi:MULTISPECIES: phosphoribosylformylglycinamidine synthase subunit PurQ [Thalassospira]|jgi:phosphoribosylformylglycinamidine synthase|uniref:Phosphoribosylformylglycinamidine synthase subunit PurQ n=1 Tax=Thalassospira povalilytica TaxID=732237 RepID=A0A8I1M6Q3_9PROT|nr:MULTISPECIES: phosphoribosylformylglycinamidine synthase subunit PurQ [Thalassospira]RCK21815.1 phosphoribosylformylglycinamidine synthase [Thalassospira profundimaris]KZB60029.1 phosphoribosylformylglycinamidine synthase [Thalassospira sp. MCCC 1A02491]MAL42108.1 phosphoribosylformylglycinamidine synthase I [Thalassospira sp.]MBN8196295.1 phosphoribosylformylglycinamidine synthase subunit PurQ [Thalassospira povalilytica]MCC4242371.1 phosphoribosylformylglycinamidine synthase subunit PurQ |tara:strand:+ start:260 stop:949 length:690 start_codon:yes stop_codon:yes gene_type:complete